jgi:GH35 family endo-1,4-beta-xylanase
VTELDFKVTNMSNLSTELQIQAQLYQKIINVLQSKVDSGVVTLNLWDLGQRLKKPSTYFQSIYDANFNPTPAYTVIKNAIINNQ